MAAKDSGDSCPECHWDAFDDMSDNFPVLSSGQWQCDDVHHAEDPICNVDESCCDHDACSVNCSSMCDGFVDCEITSTVCSDARCKDVYCESTGPACFDKSCFDESENLDTTMTDLLQDTDFQWDSAVFLPCMIDHQADLSLAHSHLPDQTAAMHQPCINENDAFPNPHSYNSGHEPLTPCQQYPKENAHLWCSPYTNQTDMCNMDMNSMLSDASLYPTNSSNSLISQLETAKMPCFQDDGAPSCSDAGFKHLGCYLRNSGDTRLLEFSKSQPQSRVHRHYHGQAHHRVTQYARHHQSHHQARKSISSQTISSFIDSPPSLDRAMSSALTSPTPGLTEEIESHICQWNYGPSSCNATFGSAGELQQHLNIQHMQPIDGIKGHGYYCRWHGCHRPDEPFSQKSKLQGHFLTHSNYKNFSCSVCGKAFARQATLERHERSHRGEKPFRCKECGKAFTDSSELKTHSRTHTGEKPFKCTFPGCDFQTGDSSNMSSHKLTHNGRRHKCTYPGCAKSFTRPDQLKRHLKTTHKLENYNIPMTPTFTIPTQIGTVS